MKNAQIIVDNISCGGCAKSITSTLEKLSGIHSVSVDIENSIVKFAYQENEAYNLVISKLSAMGYPVAGSSKTIHKIKSKVSCAIGKVKTLSQ